MSEADPAAVLAELESRAQRVETPCSEGTIVWRIWGEGPALVLGHGGQGAWSHWVRNIDTFAQHYRVIVPDFPGHGDSALPASEDHDGISAVIEGGMRALLAEGEKATFVGFSFGGVVSAGIAARHGALIASLTLAGPGGFGNPILRKLEIRRLPDESEAAARRATIRHNLLEMMSADPAAADEATVDIQADNIRTARFDSRRISLTERLVGDLARTTAPLQLIWGEHDRLVSAVYAQEFAKRISDSRVCIVADAGHIPQMENLEATLGATLGFLAEQGK